MKRKIFIISIFFVIIITSYMIKVNNKSGILVSFYNETSTNIEDLKIGFSNESRMTVVPTITPNNKISLKLNQNKDFVEGAVILKYYDINKKEHQETVNGYIEKGESIHSKVYIKSIDNNGIIDFTIKE